MLVWLKNERFTLIFQSAFLAPALVASLNLASVTELMLEIGRFFLVCNEILLKMVVLYNLFFEICIPDTVGVL